MQFLKICALLCVIPAFMSCSDDEPAAPVPNKPNIMFFHASAGTPGVDFLIDNTDTVRNLTYTQSSGYRAINQGSRKLQVNLTGTSFKSVDTTANFSNEKYYSFFIADTVTNISPLLLQDSLPTASSGKTFFRVVNLAHRQSAIDIADANGGIPYEKLRNIGFKKASAFIELNPATLNFQITSVGSPTKLYDLKPTLAANKVYTIVITGAGANGYELITNK